MYSTSQLWHVQLNIPISTAATTSQKVSVPFEIAGKPWRWVRVRNYWNWRPGTVLVTSASWSQPAISISAEGNSTPFTSNQAPFNGSTTFITTIKQNIIASSFNSIPAAPTWSPLHGEYFPKEITIGMTAIPSATSTNTQETVAVLELEFSDSLTFPVYT